ncbi:hypothetical protein LZ32DRAFT_621254 [Colletotrichum eremochloae]|nr:hypothetical protein LZ32DRAFT_621254 [Colletotrichum eremochloae]
MLQLLKSIKKLKISILNKYISKLYFRYKPYIASYYYLVKYYYLPFLKIIFINIILLLNNLNLLLIFLKSLFIYKITLFRPFLTISKYKSNSLSNITILSLLFYLKVFTLIKKLFLLYLKREKSILIFRGYRSNIDRLIRGVKDIPFKPIYPLTLIRPIRKSTLRIKDFPIILIAFNKDIIAKELEGVALIELIKVTYFIKIGSKVTRYKVFNNVSSREDLVEYSSSYMALKLSLVLYIKLQPNNLGSKAYRLNKN